MQAWTQKASTQAEVKISILDNLYQLLPRPPYTDQDTDDVAERIYEYVRERSASGNDLNAA
jgi:type I restriction enzyme, R subunit